LSAPLFDSLPQGVKTPPSPKTCGKHWIQLSRQSAQQPRRFRAMAVRS